MPAAEHLGIMTPQDPAFIHFSSEHEPPVTKPFPRGCPRTQRLGGRPSLGPGQDAPVLSAGGRHPGPARRAGQLLRQVRVRGGGGRRDTGASADGADAAV